MPKRPAPRLTGIARKLVSKIAFLVASSSEGESADSDDDHIETAIFARFATASDADDITESRAQTPLPEKDDGNARHGKTLDGTVACRRKYSDGLVNCDSCLNVALDVWSAQSNAKQRDVCRHVLNILEAAGPTGLDTNTLIVSIL